LTHVPPQSVWPALHITTERQAPAMQRSFAAQVRPHAPQLKSLVCRSRHVAPQSVSPIGQRDITSMPMFASGWLVTSGRAVESVGTPVSRTEPSGVGVPIAQPNIVAVVQTSHATR
jgi:hypothetical protein